MGVPLANTLNLTHLPLQGAFIFTSNRKFTRESVKKKDREFKEGVASKGKCIEPVLVLKNHKRISKDHESFHLCVLEVDFYFLFSIMLWDFHADEQALAFNQKKM